VIDFDIEPHVGVGPIRFGMTRAEVRKVLGKPKSTNKERDGFLDGFYVDFDEAGSVEFIEMAKSQKFRGLFHGTCLHDLLADDAVALVSKFGKYDRNHPELGHSYIYVDLQMSLWRGVMPSPDQSTDDPDGMFFEAVGAAAAGYFKAKPKKRK
jgi:hypothetical protein